MFPCFPYLVLWMVLVLSAEAVSVGAVSVWNSLSCNCKSAKYFSNFRRVLYTELFDHECEQSASSIMIICMRFAYDIWCYTISCDWLICTLCVVRHYLVTCSTVHRLQRKRLNDAATRYESRNSLCLQHCLSNSTTSTWEARRKKRLRNVDQR